MKPSFGDSKWNSSNSLADCKTQATHWLIGIADWRHPKKYWVRIQLHNARFWGFRIPFCFPSFLVDLFKTVLFISTFSHICYFIGFRDDKCWKLWISPSFPCLSVISEHCRSVKTWGQPPTFAEPLWNSRDISQLTFFLFQSENRKRS